MGLGRRGCQCPAAADDERLEGPPEASPGGSKGVQATAAGAAPQGERSHGGSDAADSGKKDPGLLWRGRWCHVRLYLMVAEQVAARAITLQTAAKRSKAPVDGQ